MARHRTVLGCQFVVVSVALLAIVNFFLLTTAFAQGRPLVKGEACGGDFGGTFPDCTLPAQIDSGRIITTKTTATNYTIGTTSANEAYAGIIYVTGAATITAPAVTPGMSFVVITIGNIAVSVDVNAADRMYLDGVALADGDKATNQSTTNDTLVCTYESAAGWYCASSSSTGTLWTDTN